MEGLDSGGQGPTSGCCAIEEEEGNEPPGWAWTHDLPDTKQKFLMFGLLSFGSSPKLVIEIRRNFLLCRVCIKSCHVTPNLLLMLSLLNDVISNSNRVRCKKWIIVNEELDKEWKEVVAGHFESCFPESDWRDWERQWKTSVWIFDDVFEIWNGRLPNANQSAIPCSYPSSVTSALHEACIRVGHWLSEKLLVVN
jgi:hypothetical protein